MTKAKFKTYMKIKRLDKYIITWTTVTGDAFRWYDDKHDYEYYMGIYNTTEHTRDYTIIDLKSGRAFIIAGKGKNKTIDDCLTRLYNMCASEFDFIKYAIESSFDEQSDGNDYYEFNNIDLIEKLKTLKPYKWRC